MPCHVGSQRLYSSIIQSDTTNRTSSVLEGGLTELTFLIKASTKPCFRENHPLTKAYVKYQHITPIHATLTLQLYIIRDQFWIWSGRKLVANVCHACVVCYCFQATKAT